MATEAPSSSSARRVCEDVDQARVPARRGRPPPKRRSNGPPSPVVRPRTPPELYSFNPYGDDEDPGSVNQMMSIGFNRIINTVKKTFGPAIISTTSPSGPSSPSHPPEGQPTSSSGPSSPASTPFFATDGPLGRTRVDSSGSGGSLRAGPVGSSSLSRGPSPSAPDDSSNRSLRSLGTVSEGSEGTTGATSGSMAIRGVLSPPPPRTAAQRLAASVQGRHPPASSPSSASSSSAQRPPPTLTIVPPRQPVQPDTSRANHPTPHSRPTAATQLDRSHQTASSSTPGALRPPHSRPLGTLSNRFSTASRPSSAAPVTSFDPAAGQTISAVTKDHHSHHHRLSLSSSQTSLSSAFDNPFSPPVQPYIRPRHASLTASISSIPNSPGLSRSSPFHRATPSYAAPDSPGLDDDTRSVRSFSGGGFRPRTESASRVIRRITGEALSKDFWMADESAKVCYDCQSVFTAWRRKHHCRICGQIFCVRCASNMIKGNRFGTEGTLRVCNICVKIMDEYDDDDDDRRSISSVATGIYPMAPSIQLDPPTDSPYSPFNPSPFLSSFSRHHESANLGAISETASYRRRGSIEDESSRPLTPDAQFQLYMGVGQGRPGRTSDGTSEGTGTDWGDRSVSNPAPFRRTIGADDEDEQTATAPVDGSGDETPLSSSHQSPNLSSPSDASAGGGEGADKENQRPFVAFPKAASTSVAPFNEGPVRPGLDLNSHSYISFPSSMDEPPDTPTESRAAVDGGGYRTRLSSRFDSNAPLPPTGLMRTRLESRFAKSTVTLNELAEGDTLRLSASGSGGGGGGGGGRPRASSISAPSQELTGASMLHFRRMLRQAIKQSGIPNGRQWMETLSKLIVKASTSIQVHSNATEDQDVRNYVKIKKVQGGKISDSEYIAGVVITKGFTHKEMPRHHVNPRLMLVKFPLEYSRVAGQFIVLEAAIAQEADYLAKLVLRIVAVRPHIVLFEQGVSRLALEGLHKANITVARSVPQKGLDALRRCTQADVIGSIDKLSQHPRMGRCANVRVQTFDHELIPGRRKTLMRFEGCPPELGCTLLLRGGDRETLRKVKEITDFMVFVAYHLRLEKMLWYDEFNILPPPPPSIHLPEMPVFSDFSAESDTLSPGTPNDPSDRAPPAVSPNAVSRRQAHDERVLSRRIYNALVPYHETILSMSTSVRFPPPFPIAKMSSLDLSLHDLRRARDEEEAALILREEKEIASIHSQLSSPVIERSDPVAVLGLIAPPDESAIVPPSQPSVSAGTGEEITPAAPEMFALPPETPSEGIPSSTSSSLSSSSVASTSTATSTSTMPPPTESPVILAIARQPLPTLVPPLPTLQSMLHKPEDVHRISALAQVEFEHAAQLKVFDWFVDAYQHNLEPKDKQGLIYLAASGKCEKDVHQQCIPSHFRRATYYQRGEDMTLGNWILQKAETAQDKCANKLCTLPNVAHYEVLVHRETRLQVAMELHSGFKARDPDQITTWSFCTLCNESTAPWYLSEQSLKISFGKFLERAFHPDPDRKPIGSCPHDYVRNHIRLFIRRNLTIRIHNEETSNFEIFLPTTRPYVRAETKLVLKNQEITASYQKSTAYWDSVAARLNSFSTIEVVDPAKMDKLRLALADLLDRLEDDRRDFLTALADAAKKSAVTDVLGVNPVLEHLLNKVEQWDDTFSELEKAFIPSDKDLRRLTEKKIRRLFANQELFGSERGMTQISSTVSEVDEKDEKDEASTVDESSQYGGESVDGTESVFSDTVSVHGAPSSVTGSTLTSEPPTSPEQEIGPAGSSLLGIPFHHLHSHSDPSTPTGGADFATPMAATGLPPVSSHLHLPTHSPPSYFRQTHLPVSPHDPNDSDSTISGMPSSLRPLQPLASPPTVSALEPEPSSSPEKDGHSPLSSSPFISRIPRRARQPNAIAGLIKRFERFEDGENMHPDEDEDEPDEDESAPSSPFVAHPRPTRHFDGVSESEQEHDDRVAAPTRPRIRRGRTEGSTGRVRSVGPGSTVFSDGEPTYGTRASSSRIPVSSSLRPPESSAALRRATGSGSGESGSRSRSGSSSRGPGPRSRPSSPNPSSTTRASKSAKAADGLAPSASTSTSLATGLGPMGFGPGPMRNGSIRASKGKGKAPPRVNPSHHVPTLSTRRATAVTGALAGKVSSYAKHFDGLSRDADRARQRQITLAKGKRARPVAVTRVTVRTLDLRAAVKDDSDSSASSEADDEDDEEPESRKKTRQGSFSLATESAPAVEPEPDDDQRCAQTIDLPGPPTDDGLSSTSPPAETCIVLADPPKAKERRPSSSLQLPTAGRVRDLVELDLDKFDTKAPLPSLPATPQYAESFSVSQSLAGHLSESEMSSAAGPERQSILKTLSGLWAFRTGEFSPIAYPFGVGVHFFKDSRVIMRDDEPTSIIAFTLSSTKYKDTIKSKKHAHPHPNEAGQDRTEHARADESEWSIVGRAEAVDYDERPTEIHAQFDYEPSAGINIFCRVFFLDEFESLRRRCGLDVEGGFIESLARCIKWESSGGKSGSAFLKTKDDRFIAKEISRLEMDALTTFAPAYFKYMNECLDEQRPTALAKIFGVYKLGYKSTAKGTVRMNVMVMENLFYERKCHVIYDLKGNTRNRHVDPTGKPGEVLLDANLEKTMWTNPIYLREYSKRILKGALANDTKFLADMQIMDYSLVVGIDLVRAELVVGVVDYIRLYTWDKKLETFVKESAFFPGGGKGAGEPTIVTPKQYKNRFRAAMNRYFVLVPDPWMSKTSLEALGEEVAAFDGGEPPAEAGKASISEEGK